MPQRDFVKLCNKAGADNRARTGKNEVIELESHTDREMTYKAKDGTTHEVKL